MVGGGTVEGWPSSISTHGVDLTEGMLTLSNGWLPQKASCAWPRENVLTRFFTDNIVDRRETHAASVELREKIRAKKVRVVFDGWLDKICVNRKHYRDVPVDELGREYLYAAEGMYERIEEIDQNLCRVYLSRNTRYYIFHYSANTIRRAWIKWHYTQIYKKLLLLQERILAHLWRPGGRLHARDQAKTMGAFAS